MQIYRLTLRRWPGASGPAETTAETIEAPDLEFALCHAAQHRWFADQGARRVAVEVERCDGP